jgi:hypothetical protein
MCPDWPADWAESERVRMQECQLVEQHQVRLPRVWLLPEPCRVQMAL